MEIDFVLPLHPMVVHMPIVVAFIAALLYGLSLILKRDIVAQAAAVAALCAALGAGAAVYTGDAEHEQIEEHWPRVAHEVIENHEEAGEMTMYVLGALAAAGAASLWLGWMQETRTRAALTLLHCAACALVVFTGHLGAELVYRYGAGVAPVRGMEPEEEIFRSHGIPKAGPSLREEHH